eukprot:m.120792 g.120792  ORF g.120792 m.120792 type:complete len:570 (-) comp17253_c0_seq1:38-1747(-)
MSDVRIGEVSENKGFPRSRSYTDATSELNGGPSEPSSTLLDNANNQRSSHTNQQLNIIQEVGLSETDCDDFRNITPSEIDEAISDSAVKTTDSGGQVSQDAIHPDGTIQQGVAANGVENDKNGGDAKRALSQNQWGMMVLSFSHDSTYVREDMTRADVLKLARRTLLNVSALADSRAGGTVPGHGLNTNSTNPGGDPISASRVPSHARSGFGGAGTSDMLYNVGTRVPTGPRRLQARDLRVLDPELGVVTDPVIMARLDAIIVMVPPVRAVILVDKCIVFLNDGADAEVGTLIDNLGQVPGKSDDTGSVYSDTTSSKSSRTSSIASKKARRRAKAALEFSFGSTKVPFEIRSLEAIFETVFQDLHRETKSLSKKSQVVVKTVIHDQSPKVLEKLRLVKTSLSQLMSRVLAIRRALETVLDNDENMAMMQLTRLADAPPDQLADVLAFGNEDVELLFEAYLRDAHSAHGTLSVMESDIATAESLIEIQLDTARNRLLALGFIFNLITITCSFSTLVAGIFGMNLESGLEDSRTAFHWTTAVLTCSTVIMPVILILALMYFRLFSFKMFYD